MRRMDIILNALEFGATRLANYDQEELSAAYNELTSRLERRCIQEGALGATEVFDLFARFRQEPDRWREEMQLALDRIAAQRDRQAQQLAYFMLERGRGNPRVPYPQPDDDEDADDTTTDDDTTTEEGATTGGRATDVRDVYAYRSSDAPDVMGFGAGRNPGDTRVPFPSGDDDDEGELAEAGAE